MSRTVAGLLLFVAAVAGAQPQPTVTELQQAAIALAEAQPDRIHAWQKRIRRAAWAPQLKIAGGRGFGGSEIIHGLNGLDEFASVQSDAWRYEATLTWTFDRLVFDPNELRLSREGQRIALHREALTTQIAQLYYARQRLIHDRELHRADDQSDQELAIDELTAILSGLTGIDLSSSGLRNAP